MANELEYKNILAPVDGSAVSEHVALKAAAVAHRNDTRLDLLYVIDTNALSGVAGMSITGDVVYHLVQDSEDKLNKLKEQVLAAFPGLEVDIHMRFGSPKKVIVSEFPNDHDTGLILIGKSGLNALERLIVGSVTTFVVQNAKTDVLIVQ
ncbi:universal stress protein [Weissella soli]|jgi:nucleotide-binding universal stress UspA family protein|uniref:Nucleotide-binding universal stress UspA family protein n=1 Tax=Weissella soli TaxID=155866 RepID=A0A288QUS3_9LACO|nr:universal stress protein [Weissella soli]AOT56858.1 Putative universal stress protein [Weissella soli]MCT8395512.1 universal stress protein [Weissella soli]NKY83309.1 universal stress protein [Weissella soli]QEA34246.1 universal stress protein [Weissella soli]RDL05399.1 nucleotide-binding universal stress UspA family protein [Weissella soli]